MNPYTKFLNQKQVQDPDTGLKKIPPLNPMLFDWQQAITRWALRRGRACIFADCGLGKTPMQLEWARHVPGRVLVIAPLAVAKQTIHEGEKFGIHAEYARHQDDSDANIVTTNYEMLSHFDPSKFAGVVLDESSILKSYDGKYRTQILEAFKNTPYRLACTATPAPNDYMELGNHSEFMGVMSRQEMLAMFFVHDGGETQKWRLKGHAETDFWEWLASWSVMVRTPEDLGYSDDRFKLPPYNRHAVTVKTNGKLDGYLFPMNAQTLQERIAARRDSVEERAQECASIINGGADPWIVWCNLNRESDRITALVDGAVQIQGSDTVEHKETAMLDFAAGKIRVLVTKPRIAGFGMNWQHCSNVAFLGLSDSWEQYYQAVRRCWRFGQEKPVNVYIVTADKEGAIVSNIDRKEKQAKEMGDSLAEHMKDLSRRNVSGMTRDNQADEWDTFVGKGWTMHLGDCVNTVSKMESDSIHFSVFSPPFASLYTYTNSIRDMGNTKTNDEFMEHFQFLVKELYRVMIPGRVVSFHCMNLPSVKVRDGIIGLKDFRGDLIRAFQAEGFIYHSEVAIWKDPVTAMQRTKALGLLHKQLKKDSCMSRMGLPDYLVSMRKPGDNPERVTHSNESYPVSEWQQVASPIWTDINPSDTLQFRSAREHKDERHIAPLQLEVIRRAMRLWSNPGDMVLSPFAGIGSEGYVALEMGRQFIGVELKRSYWNQACKNLAVAALKPQEE
ncbi:MAG TPA: DNA methyltransferase, partial [Planctomycetota bacterium]|nr:DNA methyltransferase [Planctomycetota bacterium]